jgi:hypothetical protein
VSNTKLSRAQIDKYKLLREKCKAVVEACDKALAAGQEDDALKVAGDDAFKTIIDRLLDEGNTAGAIQAARMRPNFVGH